MKLAVTNSSMSCFKACRQKYYWSYEMLWRPDKQKSALRIGSMAHEGLDMLAKGFPLPVTLDQIRHDYEANTEYQSEKLDMECVTVQCLVSGYHEVWKNSALEIIESEKEFDLPIINENGNPMTALRQAGKRDRICRLPDGRLALMETKTVSEDLSPESDFRKVLGINHQISMYTAAARAEGIDISTVVYDCIRKPTIKPCDVPELDEDGLKIVVDEDGNRIRASTGRWRQTADSAGHWVVLTRPMTPEEWREKLTDDIQFRPSYYYARFEVPRLESDLAEFETELWMCAKDILECRRLKRWYRNTNHCRLYNSLCAYYPLCSGRVDTTNGCPSGFRVAETDHEELNPNP